ncbi:hypothetical protein ACFCWB_27450 [Streptomyces bacillaris]|uniref:hypothetical protein n=1 Tax=Streptomyces bacillaris TaxID=68179 RepID=UPI0035E287FF
MSTTPTYTHDQIEQAITNGFDMAADHAGIPAQNSDFNATLNTFWANLAVTDATAHTRDEVSAALNQATDDAAKPGCADDIDNFAVNAALTLLETPDATFDDVATECYGEDPDVIAGWLRAAA